MCIFKEVRELKAEIANLSAVIDTQRRALERCAFVAIHLHRLGAQADAWAQDLATYVSGYDRLGMSAE